MRGVREMEWSGEDMSIPSGRRSEVDSEEEGAGGGGGKVNDSAIPASEAVERKGKRKISIPSAN